MAEDLEEVRKELAAYVSFRRRTQDPDYSLGDALLEHRRGCLQNLSDSEDQYWAERVKVLDRLAAQIGAPSIDEPALRFVQAEVEARERRRREERRRLREGRVSGPGGASVVARGQDGKLGGTSGNAPPV